jgi:hypothetical protein
LMISVGTNLRINQEPVFRISQSAIREMDGHHGEAHTCTVRHSARQAGQTL